MMIDGIPVTGPHYFYQTDIVVVANNYNEAIEYMTIQ